MLVASVTVSLDGCVAGPGISREEPMGEGGARLHEWIMDPTPTDLEIISETFAAVGAVVLGRRTFDVGRAHWNDDTPYPAPSFVVTHTVSLEEGPGMYKTFRDKEDGCIKVVLKP